jgi:hypothetical protein
MCNVVTQQLDKRVVAVQARSKAGSQPSRIRELCSRQTGMTTFRRKGRRVERGQKESAYNGICIVIMRFRSL